MDNKFKVPRKRILAGIPAPNSTRYSNNNKMQKDARNIMMSSYNK